MTNILSLSKIKDENYLTRIFSYLLSTQQGYASCILKKCFDYEILPDEIFVVECEKSIENKYGRPDITIRIGTDKKIALENKIYADFTENQIPKYKQDDVYDKVFILYKAVTSVEQFSKSDKAVSWHDISIATKQFNNQNLILREFCNYLKEEGFTVEKVGYEIINGGKALSNLHKMIINILEDKRKNKKIISYNRSGGSFGYTPFTIEILSKKSFVLYINYTDIILLLATTYDKNIKEKLNLKTGNEMFPDIPFYEACVIDYFDFEDSSFLCKKSAEDQKELISNFINSVIEKLKTIFEA